MSIDIEKLNANPSAYMAEAIQQKRDEAWKEFKEAKCQGADKGQLRTTQEIWNYAFAKANQALAELQMEISEAVKKGKKSNG